VLGSYGDQLRSAILRCKRPGGEPLVAALAGLLVARHRDTLGAWGIDLVVPVPMHWSRRMVRGVSAADELAAVIARLLRVPCRANLRRAVATRMQNELPVSQRQGNVATAFRSRGGVSSKTILVVDDVCTTGSTLAACSGCLKTAGASAVYAAVVAKADRSSHAGDD
jgi:ComF family protein